jgi:hypothetical protein
MTTRTRSFASVSSLLEGSLDSMCDATGSHSIPSLLFKEPSAAIPPATKPQGHPPQRAARAAKCKQPPQQARRFGKQTFRIGCRPNHHVSMTTNYVFCSYIDRFEIVPNSTFNPHPKLGQVNMFNKHEIMKFEQHGKKSCCSNRFDHHVFREINHEKQNNNRCNGTKLCLTIAFHLDLANAKQGEQRALGRPSGRDIVVTTKIKECEFNVINSNFEIQFKYA